MALVSMSRSQKRIKSDGVMGIIYTPCLGVLISVTRIGGTVVVDLNVDSFAMSNVSLNFMLPGFRTLLTLNSVDFFFK